MGLFDLFFSSGAKYPQNEYYLTEKEIRALVSKIHVKSLEQGEERAVEDAIVARRRGDGKIALRHIYEALLHLQYQKKISKWDREKLMEAFQKFFEDKYGKK